MTLGIDICHDFLGLQEHNDKATIEKLLASQAHNGDINLNPEITAWCAGWINFCERSAGNQGNGHLNARSFLTYGTHVELKDIQRGDIMVFSRGNNGYSGHVTYFEGHSTDGTQTLCTGGNQGLPGSVCTEVQNIDRLLGIRRS